MIFAAIGYSGYGYKRKARDVAVWMSCGFLFFVVLAIVFVLTLPRR